MRRPTARRRSLDGSPDEGFTLIELLVVLVIIPLIIGAAAEALIVSFRTTAASSNTLSDTVNGQTTSAFFIQDVRSASYITTYNNTGAVALLSAALTSGSSYNSLSVNSLTWLPAAGSVIYISTASAAQAVTVSATPALGATSLAVSAFTAHSSYPAGTQVTNPYVYNAPEVCGRSSSQGTFLVGLYHPPTSSSSGATTALSVGYWLDGSGNASTVDRYACSVNTSTWVSTGATEAQVATPPPGVTTGDQLESLTAGASLSPSWLGDAAANGWTLSQAYAQVSAAGTVPAADSTIAVSTTFGFNVGSSGGTVCDPTSSVSSAAGCSGGVLTVATLSGPITVTCTGFTATSFTGCTSSTPAFAPNGSTVSQSSVSGVHIEMYEPASSYHYSLLSAPTSGSAAAGVTGGSGSPTLLTLGSKGINPIHGGGGSTCPDGARANICVEAGSVFIDGGGTANCTGGGPHSYIDTPGGGVGTVQPPGSSSCNNVNISTGPGVPDPIGPYLPSCFPQSLADSLGTGATVGAGASAFQTPGVYTSALSGKLAPGVYIVKGGIGTITGMAPNSGASASYYNGDSSAGVLLYNPGSGYTSSSCLNGAGSALSGSVTGIVPLDTAQSVANFSGNTTLGGIWYWQDQKNFTTMGTTGSTGQGNPLTNCGLAYLPSGEFSIGGSGSLTTGSMIAGDVQLNGTPTLILTGT